MASTEKPRLFGLDISMAPFAQLKLASLEKREREIYRWRYEQFDSAMVTRSTHINEWHLKQYLHNKSLHPAYARIEEFKKLSMLHEDVLLLLRMYAQAARGAILEIGPYVGGSTIAIADGVRAGGRGVPFLSIEIGGRYPEHPQIPSDDIFGDLVRNVTNAGLTQFVELIKGGSREASVIERVKLALGEHRISLVFIDSDGNIGADWAIYRQFMADDVIIVLDDYEAPLTALKADLVRPWVERVTASGQLRQLGVFGWGTWFGQATDVFAHQSANDSNVPERVVPEGPAAAGSELVNPHFDHKLVVWEDSYSGRYHRVPYDQQFDDQWRLFLERAVGFCNHTGVETTDTFIEDRIEELTGVDRYIQRRNAGEAPAGASGLSDAETRATGGTLLLEPKFPIDHFRGKRCLDVGCGAGRWTRVLRELGADVKSIDVSEHGLQSTRRFNDDVEKIDVFELADRHDLHETFDFVICWGVIMCTHDPKLAFDLVASTVKPGGELYIMVYAPTFHASDFVTQNRERYHRQHTTFESKLAFAYQLSDDPRNAINLLDMLNTFYNWTIPEAVVHAWYRDNGFEDIVTLNRNEVHNCGWHVLGRKAKSVVLQG